jgi:hypothetical protein
MIKNIILFKDFFKLFQICLLTNLLVSLFLFVNENDFSNLPQKEKPIDRYIALLFYNTSLFSSCGYGTIVPLSNRMIVFTIIYLIIITSGILFFLFNLFLHRSPNF